MQKILPAIDSEQGILHLPSFSDPYAINVLLHARNLLLYQDDWNHLLRSYEVIGAPPAPSPAEDLPARLEELRLEILSRVNRALNLLEAAPHPVFGDLFTWAVRVLSALCRPAGQWWADWTDYDGPTLEDTIYKLRQTERRTK